MLSSALLSPFGQRPRKRYPTHRTGRNSRTPVRREWRRACGHRRNRSRASQRSIARSAVRPGLGSLPGRGSADLAGAVGAVGLAVDLQGDPHGKRQADVPPGQRIAVLTVDDQPFRIHTAVEHLRRVVGMCRQRDQVGKFLLVTLSRALLGLGVDPYVRDLLQPPAATSLRCSKERKVRALSRFFSTKSN